ncbi:MAG: hypothetical protein WDM90_07785 [Ferruginibacter sp.]
MKKTTLHLEAPWKHVKELLKEVNGELTDDDLLYEPEKKMNCCKGYRKKWEGC